MPFSSRAIGSDSGGAHLEFEQVGRERGVGAGLLCHEVGWPPQGNQIDPVPESET